MGSDRDNGRARWVLAAVSTALFCIQIDYFAMNLALRRMVEEQQPVIVMGVTCVAAAVSLGVLAASQGWVICLIALSACGFTLSLVFAFTTVATQAVVRPERAGEAAGIALTSLVTLAGVGVAVSGTVFEQLQPNGMPTGGAIDAIFLALAALLLPAGLAVTMIARTQTTALPIRTDERR